MIGTNDIDLKGFIKATLHAVVEAVDECQSEIKSGAVVAPPMRQNTDSASEIGRAGVGYYSVTSVDFDVCVSARRNADSKEGIGAGITVLFVGLSHSDSQKDEQVSRVRFSIPVALSLPQGEMELIPVGC